jgi:hypothetical protein
MAADYISGNVLCALISLLIAVASALSSDILLRDNLLSSLLRKTVAIGTGRI